MTEDEFRRGKQIIDPNAVSLLEAQRLAAERVQAKDREWARLREVDRIARALMLAKPEDREELTEELGQALWPQEEQP